MCFVLTCLCSIHWQDIEAHSRSGEGPVWWHEIGLCYLQMISSRWLNWTVLSDVHWGSSLTGKRCPCQVQNEQLLLWKEFRVIFTREGEGRDCEIDYLTIKEGISVCVYVARMSWQPFILWASSHLACVLLRAWRSAVSILVQFWHVISSILKVKYNAHIQVFLDRGLFTLCLKCQHLI